jgi:hypothetical protein
MKKTVYGFIMAVALVLGGCETPSGPGGGGTEQLPPIVGAEQFYDANGWHKTDPNDMHNYITNSDYGTDGWSRDGWNINGSEVNKNGSLWGDDGYNRAGWKDGEPNNKYTGTEYGKDNYNRAGYDPYGWNKEGFNISGGNADKNGFRQDGTYGETGSPYCSNADSPYNGLDRDGYDTEGWYRFPIKEYDLSQYSAPAFSPNPAFNKNGQQYVNGLGKDGYDVYGWYKYSGANAFITTGAPNYGTHRNGSQVDNDGLDIDGCDANGWYRRPDVNHIMTNKNNGQLYYNGFNKNGGAEPVVNKLDGLNVTAASVDVAFDKGNTYGGGTSWALLNGIDNETGGRGYVAYTLMGGTTPTNFKNSYGSTVIAANTALKTGYTMVATAYNSVNSGIGEIASAEANLATFAQYNSDPFGGSGVITENEKDIIDALFGTDESIVNDDTAKALKAAFKAELKLYQAILYYEQKQRFCEEGASEANAQLKPKKSTLETGISTLEIAVKTTTGDNNYFNGLTTYTQKADKLFLELTDKINAQMELDSNASITSPDAEKIKELNEALVTQLGDFAEFEAMVNDIKDLSYMVSYTIDWQMLYNVYNEFLVTLKSGLQFDSKSFDPNFLKQDLFLANGKKDEEQTALA